MNKAESEVIVSNKPFESTSKESSVQAQLIAIYTKYFGEQRSIHKSALITCSILVMICHSGISYAYHLSNNVFAVETGKYGNIDSIKIQGDTYPTNYVMNADNSPEQDTLDQQWFGALLFEYRVGDGDWKDSSTNASGDVRNQSLKNNVVTVRYENSQNPKGIRDFRLTSQYQLIDDYLSWKFTLTNTSDQPIEFGDIGVPMPFNEKWKGKIYEERVLKHSYVGRDGSFIYALRPSGIGPFILLTPEPGTHSGFEFQNLWHSTYKKYINNPETTFSKWNAFTENNGLYDGLNVFYIHAKRLQEREKSSYFGTTSMTLQPGESKTYGYRLFRVSDEEDMRAKLYREGMIDVHVVPGMIVPNDQTVKVDLHTSQAIERIEPQYPATTTFHFHHTVDGDHNVYQFHFHKLGPNNVTVHYGDGQTTVLQFYVIENIGKAVEQRANFIVNKQQVNDPSKPWYKVFDGYLMDEKKQRGLFGRNLYWGDDWGFAPGVFLAEKNTLLPNKKQAQALNDYVQTFLWENHMRDHHQDYMINNFWQNPQDPPPGFETSTLKNHVWLYRGYTYMHVINTFYSMYKLEKNYPNLIQYSQSAKTYLKWAGHVMNTLFNGKVPLFKPDGSFLRTDYVSYSISGLMGESVLPETLASLKKEGFNDLVSKIEKTLSTEMYPEFQKNPYPYASEYNFDNTGEEAVYMLAKKYHNLDMMAAADQKTRACRSIAPVWYQYAAPIGINGELFWNFQYTTSLAGYIMDDWARTQSKHPEQDIRMAYATKIASFILINTGQINADPDNIGAVSWTYQADKGLLNAFSDRKLQNGFRPRSGEGDLGLFGGLRILSSDVSQDPIFGLTCYGCKVMDEGASYRIIPNDGRNQVLNLISEKRSLTLERDQYLMANIRKDGTHATLTLLNQSPQQAHTTRLKLSGFAPGNYHVIANNRQTTDCLTIEQDKVASVDLHLSGSMVAMVDISPTPFCPKN
jgi:hypothetical protein